MEAEFNMYVDESLEASACGPRADAIREILRYVHRYQADGEITVEEVSRKFVDPHALAAEIGLGPTT